MRIQKIKKEILILFVQSQPPQPAFFFLQIALGHAFGELYQAPLIFIALLVLAILGKKNYFWFAGIIINSGLGYLGILNILIGLFSCNEIWILQLFLYGIFDSLLLNYSSVNTVFNIVAAFLLVTQTYLFLPFKDLITNYIYFMGFSVLWIYHTFNFLAEVQIIYSIISPFVIGSIVCLGLFISFLILRERIRFITNSSVEEISELSLYLHYIEDLKIKLNEPLQQIGIIEHHKLECVDTICYCRDNTQQLSFNHMFIRSLYKRAFAKFENTFEQFLIREHYIQHLLNYQMFPLAIQQFLKLTREKNHQNNFLRKIWRIKLQRIIKVKHRKIQEEYELSTRFQNAFGYQKNYETFRGYIIDIIERKIDFWSQVSKVTTKMSYLRATGKILIKKINQMDLFYKSQIHPIQNEIQVYYGSIIYNLFLLIATNYKQKAQQNLKMIKKNTDSTKVDIKKHLRSFYIKVSINKTNFGNIENITSNFLKLIKTNSSKSSFIGKSMSFLVPKSYEKQHFQAMKSLRRYSHNNYMGVAKTPIFFNDACQNIVPCSLVVKYSIDILNQLSVVGMVKQFQNNCEYALLTLDGECESKSSSQVDQALLKSVEIKEKVNLFKSKWEGSNLQQNQPYFKIDPIRFQIRHKQNSYTCILDSPLSCSFRYPNPPPLHLNIHNESQNYFLQHSIISQNEQIFTCIKKINNILDHAESDSQASYITRNQSIDVLTKIQQIANKPIYNKFFILLGIIYLVIFLLSLSFCIFFNLSWINTSSNSGNHYQLLITLYEIQLQTTRMLNKAISIYVLQNNIGNNPYFSSVYGVPDYQGTVYQSLNNICNSLHKNVAQNFTKEVINIDPLFTSKLLTKMNVTTMYRKVNYTQFTSLNSMLRHNINDCFELVNKVRLNNTAIGQYYWQSFYPNFIDLINTVKKLLSASLDSNFYNNLVMLIIFQILILLSCGPIYFLSKKITQEEFYIFQLIISVDVDYIHKQLSQLIDFQRSLTKSNKTDETINQNTNSQIDVYFVQKNQEENLISSKRKKRTGELEVDETKCKNGTFRYFSVVFSMTLILLQFLMKNQKSNIVIANLANQIKIREWRNQRLELLVNMRKNFTGYQISQLINGKSNYNWIIETINNRASNYPTEDLPYNLSLNCTNPIICGANTTLSTYLILDSYFSITASKVFFTRDMKQSIFLELLEEVCSSVVANQQTNFLTTFNTQIDYYNNTLTLIFAFCILVLILNESINILHYMHVKKEYKKLNQMIALLSQEMIKKNKRIESFLQKISKAAD